MWPLQQHKKNLLPLVFFLFASVTTIAGLLPSRRPMAQHHTNNTYFANVVHVADGDTFTVVTENSHQRVTIRLYGIDCPEREQPYGHEATAITKRILGQTVQVEPVTVDKYDRTVAIVSQEAGTTLEELLLEQGAAWFQPRFCKMPVCKTWERMENEARQSHRGLWAAKKATPPWGWRKEEFL